MIKEFPHKCTCDWSEEGKYGFIPNTECKVHGKQTRKTLSKCVPVQKTAQQDINKTKTLNLHEKSNAQQEKIIMTGCPDEMEDLFGNDS